MKTMCLKRLLKHLLLFQKICLHPFMEVILLILFPRLWLKRADFSFDSKRNPLSITSLNPREAHTFLLDKESIQRTDSKALMDTKSKQESINQGLGNSPKRESNFLNISQTLHFLDMFLTKIGCPFLTANHPRPIFKPRSLFTDSTKEKSNIHSYTTMSPYKVLRNSTGMQNYLSQNFAATSFASFASKRRSQSGGEDINRITLFSFPLARAAAIIVSLLFSYLTATPAFGQEPVGLRVKDTSKKGDPPPELANANMVQQKKEYKIEHDFKKPFVAHGNGVDSESVLFQSVLT